MKARCSPLVIAIAFMAFTVSLTRGSALAFDQDISPVVAAATRAMALSVTPSVPRTLRDDGVVADRAVPAPVPRDASESPDRHGVATTIAGVTTGMFVLLQGVDIAQTMQCVGASSCREANPFLRSLAHKPAAFGATKMAIAFVSGYALFHARGKHPKLVTALSIAGIGLYATITYRQARLNRR